MSRRPTFVARRDPFAFVAEEARSRIRSLKRRRPHGATPPASFEDSSAESDDARQQRDGSTIDCNLYETAPRSNRNGALRCAIDKYGLGRSILMLQDGELDLHDEHGEAHRGSAASCGDANPVTAFALPQNDSACADANRDGRITRSETAEFRTSHSKSQTVNAASAADTALQTKKAVGRRRRSPLSAPAAKAAQAKQQRRAARTTPLSIRHDSDGNFLVRVNGQLLDLRAFIAVPARRRQVEAHLRGNESVDEATRSKLEQILR